MAADAVHRYVEDWRPGRAEGPLFLTEEGKPFSLPGFKNYLARLGDRFKAAGIENWMAHRSRHYWATSAHRAGMSVFDIAAEGGWRDLKMVQRYTKNRRRAAAIADAAVIRPSKARFLRVRYQVSQVSFPEIR